MLTKQNTIYREEQPRKGTQENCSATWLTASGFMGMGLGSRLSLVSHLPRPYLVWLRILPGVLRLSPSRWIPVPRILGGWSSPPSY